MDGNRAQKGLIEGIPGLVVERWKYLSTDAGLDDEIESQSSLESGVKDSVPEIFDKDVEVIMKDGKYFYVRGESK